jgi:nickel/cobalt transporter (NiCoT) family protein
MELVTLFLFVFVLGLRHGLDADHLACIDGLTRYNWRMKSPLAPWAGTLFSFGHGLVVTGVAVILGTFSQNFTFPSYFDTLTTWISVVSLFLIGTMNLYNLLRMQPGEEFRLRGIKGKFLPRFAQETTRPFMIVLIGALFALAADTVSQTAVWTLAAGNSSGRLSLFLGLTFMLGMMLVDTVDSQIAYRMLHQSRKIGQSVSRAFGWAIVVLAYGVSFYEAFNFFVPEVELDFEVVGTVLFVLLVSAFLWVRILSSVRAGAVPTKE